MGLGAYGLLRGTHGAIPARLQPLEEVEEDRLIISINRDGNAIAILLVYLSIIEPTIERPAA